MKVRNIFGLSAALGLLLCVEPVVAGESSCGEWAVGAQALYLTPMACPFSYAQETVLTGPATDELRTSQALLVPCRAEWGFRVFSNYTNGCIFAGVGYQRFDVSTRRSTEGNLLFLTGGFGVGGPGRATGQTDFNYQNADVRLGKYLLRRCRGALYLYGNARWVDLSYRRRAQAFFSANANFEFVQGKSRLEGGALGIGLGGKVDVWCGIGAFVDCNVLGVIAKRSLTDVKHVSITQPARIEQVSYPSDTCVIPEVNSRIGVNYTYECGCWKLVGELGYEVDYFWNGAAFPDLSNLVTNGIDFVQLCQDVGFSGLFIGGRLIY